MNCRRNDRPIQTRHKQTMPVTDAHATAEPGRRAKTAELSRRPKRRSASTALVALGAGVARLAPVRPENPPASLSIPLRATRLAHARGVIVGGDKAREDICRTVHGRVLHRRKLNLFAMGSRGRVPFFGPGTIAHPGLGGYEIGANTRAEQNPNELTTIFAGPMWADGWRPHLGIWETRNSTVPRGAT